MKKNKGLGIAAMILGVLGLLSSCIFIGIIFDVLAVILGIIALADKTSAKGLPITGIVTGTIGIAVVLLAFAIFMSDTDTTDSNTEKEQTESKDISQNSESATENKDEFEYNDFKVKYLRHEIIKNSVDETVLVVYYDFTNNSDDAQCFSYLVTGTAFQNGVEVEKSFFHANEESKNSDKEIQKGATITVADSYVLGENRDNVTIELRPFNIWSDELLMSLDLKLE